MFIQFAQGCPYCEGNPEVGAVCHYYGEAAFVCNLKNCPLNLKDKEEENGRKTLCTEKRN